MSSNDAQSVFAAAGCLFGGGILVALVFTVVKLRAVWPDTARQFGLVLEENPSKNQRSLKGVVSGVALQVQDFSETTGNTTRSGTRVFARALAPAQRQFSLQIERPDAGGAKYHVVDTGDPAFDRAVILKSEEPDAVRLLLDAEVRKALLWLTRQSSLTYDRGELCVAFGGTASSKQELESMIRLAIAAAKVRLT